MKRVFKSAEPDARRLIVDVFFTGPRLLIKDFDGDNKGFIFNGASAPAIALAVLEAAGYDDKADDMSQAESYAFDAMHKLQQSVDEQERATAEARERAELEAEAFELATLYQGYGEWAKGLSFSDLDEDSQKKWLDVARRARELGANRG